MTLIEREISSYFGYLRDRKYSEIVYALIEISGLHLFLLYWATFQNYVSYKVQVMNEIFSEVPLKSNFLLLL